jgi:hypothetical protein
MIDSKPDFIGIGAQRSGTSWLFDQLKRHPEFTLPFIKEFHYFDRNRKYPSPNFIADKFFIKRLANVNFSKRMIADFTRAIRNKDNERLKWFLNFYLPNISDSWYLSQFSKLDGLTGEFSPSYSILEVEDIIKIKNLLPNVKLIFIIRDPIERAWSSFRFNYSKNRIKKSLDYKDIIDYFDSPGQELRSNYLRSIQNYGTVFKTNQMIVGFYDAIIEQPHNLVNGIAGFLGAKQRIYETSNKLFLKNNASPEMEIPEKVLQFLSEKYREDISQLSKNYSGYCMLWYQKYFEDISMTPLHNIGKLPPALIHL